MRVCAGGGSGRKLYVHVGLPKTGTTTIQERLAAEAGALRQAAGTLYPRAGRSEGFPAHHNLAYEIGGDPRFASTSGGWQEVLAETERGGDVLVSSEELFNVFLNKPEAAVRWLREAGEAFDVHVVAAVRSYPEYLDSLYTMQLRALASDMTPDQFFAAQQRALGRVAQALMVAVATVGRDHVHLVEFEVNRDAWADFREAVGLTTEERTAQALRSNARIGVRHAVALFRLAQHEEIRAHSWLERAVIAKTLIERLEPGPTHYSLQSPSRSAAIARDASAAFRYVDAVMGTNTAQLHRPTDAPFVDLTAPQHATDDLLRVVADFVPRGEDPAAEGTRPSSPGTPAP